MDKWSNVHYFVEWIKYTSMNSWLDKYIWYLSRTFRPTLFQCQGCLIQYWSINNEGLSMNWTLCFLNATDSVIIHHVVNLNIHLSSSFKCLSNLSFNVSDSGDRSTIWTRVHIVLYNANMLQQCLLYVALCRRRTDETSNTVSCRSCWQSVRINEIQVQWICCCCNVGSCEDYWLRYSRTPVSRHASD